ncbi:MAG: ribbon-helix-helix domain-containing protein [Bdellovibrionales bacterium]
MQVQPNTKASKPFLSQPQLVPSSDSKKDKSSLVSRNVTIGTHRTSIRLEPDMWNGLREICRREHVSMHEIATVVSERKSANTSLTAAIRVFVMAYFRMAATEEGHNNAGHDPGGSFMSSLMSRRSDDQDNNVTVFSSCARVAR